MNAPINIVIITLINQKLQSILLVDIDVINDSILSHDNWCNTWPNDKGIPIEFLSILSINDCGQVSEYGPPLRIIIYGVYSFNTDDSILVPSSIVREGRSQRFGAISINRVSIRPFSIKLFMPLSALISKPSTSILARWWWKW